VTELDLATARLGRPTLWLEECTSTSDEAARRAREQDAENASEGLLVVAESQTGGRGRLGRSWHSPAGSNLYFSLVLRPRLPTLLVPPLTLLVGAVLADVLAERGAAPRLKWPNDLLLPAADGRPRKVAGILTEMASERDRIRHVVVGVGINVNVEAFPPELADRATSLRLSTGRAWDRRTLLAAFLDALEPAYDRFVAAGPAEALARWRARANVGAACRVARQGASLEGIVEGIDDEGALLVRDARGALHRVVSGEVS
jgi:BirA family biotin operon repressor/biotin-[acetyl-CoA-carboxylase] ligase